VIVNVTVALGLGVIALAYILSVAVGPVLHVVAEWVA